MRDREVAMKQGLNMFGNQAVKRQHKQSDKEVQLDK